jgi:hypothetical protein
MKDLQTQLTAMINAQIQRSLQTYITQATDQALAKILGSQPEPKATWSKRKTATPAAVKPKPRRPSRRLSAGNNALVSLVSYAGGVGPMKFKVGKRNAKVWAFIKNVLSDGHEVPRVALTKHAAAACGSNYACISRDISVFLEKRMLTTRPNPEK